MTDARPLEIGLNLPTWPRRDGSNASWPEIRRLALDAEALGVDTLWVPDHLLRRPQSAENNDVLNGIKTGRLRQEDLAILESNALSSLRRFSRGEVPLEEALDHVVRYTRMVSFAAIGEGEGEAVDRAIGSIRKEYERTLEARPWETCTCKVCRDCGIEVVIYRSNNRNRRRGFHNLEVFYKHLETLKGTPNV